jgi:AcrR family transcriptional regulator
VSDPVRPLAEADVRGPANRPSAAGTEGPESPFGSAREKGSARERIVEVARNLFCARGYERTPLRAVSDSLGVTKAAIYYHFKAKEDLLVAILGPVLDRIDSLIDAAGDGFESPAEIRLFLGRYLDELAGDAGIVALLRDPGVAESRLGGRFISQHARMRALLGAGTDPASVIRTTTALRGLELAVIEFGDAHPDAVRETALDIALSVLGSGSAPSATR